MPSVVIRYCGPVLQVFGFSIFKIIIANAVPSAILYQSIIILFAWYCVSAYIIGAYVEYSVLCKRRIGSPGAPFWHSLVCVACHIDAILRSQLANSQVANRGRTFIGYSPVSEANEMAIGFFTRTREAVVS